MGDHEDWAQPGGLLPNGLLPGEAASITRPLDRERWSKAEERTAELIACIQPNQPSEERRNAVADYVQRLIMKCFSCQVFTFGSVPLKTYLPDGDIDLTAFSENQNLKDTWAQKVRDILEKEEKSESAEFRVKEVQYIQAEVKIIKCLVENIVVDISFNQLGGLCTLCFLEEVDHLINQNHLFKRSIILIKAWCYYESRILGAHHGLISTYALETLVLYIFHVFNNSFAGPLEVLYRFLVFFSNFDWDNFCVSLWGPVPISLLPDMTAKPPRRDSGELLLSKPFLDACSSVYAVFPGGQENQGQPFVSKHFNVIDPLRTNNNLGRSVSKGNFFRIRSAFAFGAKRLARLLECQKEHLIAEVNQFFMNTWDRHGSGHRPDAPSPDLCPLRPLNPEPIDVSGKLKNQVDSKKKGENSGLQSGHDSQVRGAHAFHGISSQPSNTTTRQPPESISRTNNMSAISRTQGHKHYENWATHADKGQKSSQPDYSLNEHGLQGRYQFARTRSSPELTDTVDEVSSQGRPSRMPEPGKSQTASSRQEYGNRRKNLGSDVLANHSSRTSTDERSYVRHSSSHQSLDMGVESNSAANSYHDDTGMLDSVGEEPTSVSETLDMHQEEQDAVNMMASSRIHSFDGQVQVPLNLGSSHLPLPLLPSVLASTSYAQRNMPSVVPTNFPLIDPAWGSNMQFHPSLVPTPLPHYFPSVGLTSNPEEMVESGNESSGLTEMSQEDSDGFWNERNSGSGRGFFHDNGSFQISQSDEHQQSTPGGSNISSSRMSNSDSSFTRGHQRKLAKENRGVLREGRADAYQFQSSRGNDVNTTDRNLDLRFLQVVQPSSSSSRSKPSECSWDGSSSAKVSKSSKDKRGRKSSLSAAPAQAKATSGWQYEGASSDHASSQADDDNKDWVPPVKGIEMVERSTGVTSVAPQTVRSHQLLGYEPAQISGSDSVIPIAPVLVGPGSRQRVMDSPSMVPFTYFLPGPFTYLTMLPVYNFPAETGNSDGSTSHYNRDEGLDNSSINHSDENFDSSEMINQSDAFNSPRSTKGDTTLEPSEEHKSDILNSDFASHWQNLQYGRLCQNSRLPAPLIYPSPFMVPPVYLQGHFPLEGPGRPFPANLNVVTQLMSYGPRLVPVAPLQPGSNRPGGPYQRFGDEVPRYRGGTGTYLPNPKASFRDRQSSSSRNHRGNYNYDRHDHNDREGNWSMNLKPRAIGRGHGRNQGEKPNSRPDRLAAADSRADRQWDSYRHDPFPLYQSQNGPLSSTNSMQSSANMAYGTYPLPAVTSNGLSPNGPTVPSVFMLYSYDNDVGYGSPAEQLEFGSFGPVQFSGLNETSQLSDGGPVRNVYEQRHSAYQGGSSAHTSPDQPSSPQLRRGI